MVVVGKRSDTGEKCTLLAVWEVGGDWCLYPHGVGTLGVRLSRAEAARLSVVLADGLR